MTPTHHPDARYAADVLYHRWNINPEIGLVTGSGYRYAPANGILVDCIGYQDIPGLTVSSVSGHSSSLELREVDGKHVVVCSGRLHMYEGHNHGACMQLVTILHALGLKTLIITNAAGGLHWRYRAGDIALITDTIDMTFAREHLPLAGLKRETSDSRSRQLMNTVIEQCALQNLDLETGTYCQVSGPSYETRAEIRMLRRIGADLVGMSTVRELRHAHALGMRAIGYSMVTNTLSDSVHRLVTHDEVLDVAAMAGTYLNSILDTTFTLA